MLRTARSLFSRSAPTRRFLNPISPSLHRIPSRPPTRTPTSLPFLLNSKFRLTSATRLGKRAGVARGLSAGQLADHSKEVDEINLRFAEAREEIEAALDSKETVYFDEEAECAREAVKVVLDMFDALLQRLPEEDRSALQRSMGLKIEQLKAELRQLDD